MSELGFQHKVVINSNEEFFKLQFLLAMKLCKALYAVQAEAPDLPLHIK